jgi:integrase
MRSRGSWEMKYELPADPVTGRRRSKTATIRGSKRDAQRELRRILNSLDEGAYADPGRITVGQYLDDWLAGRRPAISLKTYSRYEDLIRLHIRPVLGEVELRKLSTTAINQFYADRLESGRVDGNGGLAPRTVGHLDRLIHAAFEDAVRDRLLARNPAQYACRPKVERKPKRVLDDEEFRAVLDKAAGGPLYCPLYVILSTGIRRGELLALRWRHVDLDASVLVVVEAVEETRHGVRVKAPKTAAGRRRVDLPASTVEVLRSHQLQQKKHHLVLGLGWAMDTLVFPTIEGTPWRPCNFTKSVGRLARSAGVEGFGPHAGRHTHFSRLLEAGVHPKIAQIRAGHSSIQVTMDAYSHSTDALQRAAAERIDNAFREIREGSGGISVAISPSAPKDDLVNN